MRITVLALTGWLLLGSSALFADDASKNAKIEQFLLLIKANSIESQIYSEVTQQINTVADTLATRAGIPAPERSSATADLRNKMTDVMKQNFTWEMLRPGLVKAYSENYSEGDIDQLIAFFKSPIGQTYLAKSPVIAEQTRVLAEGHMKDMQTKVQALAKDWLDSHQNGAAVPHPPAPAPAK